MINEKIYLSKEYPDCYIEAFVPDTIDFYKKDALLIFPGGGYAWLSNHKEGEPIALDFCAKGIAAFVLHYSVGKESKFPTPLIQASLAMKYIKDNADKYNLNKDRVFAIGFSAGGHLCASLGSLWNMPEIYEKIHMPIGYNKPKGTLLIYPVITSNEKYAHMGSFYHLLGTETPDEDMLKKYSIEYCVGEHSSPSFLVHTASDTCVNVNNSLLMGQALNEYKIPFEMHIFPTGSHGSALGSEVAADSPDMNNFPLSLWPELARKWIKSIE